MPTFGPARPNGASLSVQGRPRLGQRSGMSPELAVAQAAVPFRSRQLAKAVGELRQRVATDDQLPFALVVELVAATPPQPDIE
jgi:hypothetical protein